MGFIDEIKSAFGWSEVEDEQSYRAVIFGEGGIYVERVKKIISYEPSEINLLLKKGTLKVKGEKLYVKKYCMGDVCVCGKVTAIERGV